MVHEEDLAKLRARVIRLEGQVNFLYKKLNLEFEVWTAGKSAE